MSLVRKSVAVSDECLVYAPPKAKRSSRLMAVECNMYVNLFTKKSPLWVKSQSGDFENRSAHSQRADFSAEVRCERSGTTPADLHVEHGAHTLEKPGYLPADFCSVERARMRLLPDNKPGLPGFAHEHDTAHTCPVERKTKECEDFTRVIFPL